MLTSNDAVKRAVQKEMLLIFNRLHRAVSTNTQSRAHLQGVELTLELIILLLKIIYDGLILSNVLLHCPCVLAHMGLDLLSSVSVLEGVHRVMVLHAR